MGLDGFSMGVLGINTDLTSAQMASQAEQLAQKGSEFKIKDVSESAQDQGVKRRDENSQEQEFEDGFKKDDDDEQEENENEVKSSLTERDFENRNPKDFSVRINPLTEMVELFSNTEDRVLETISAKDLMGLISKLSEASGVLVNRKI